MQKSLTRSVIFSAFRAGSLQAVQRFTVSHSHTSSVLAVVCFFKSPVKAGSFAARWAQRLGQSVPIKRAGRQSWAVQVCIPLPSGFFVPRQAPRPAASLAAVAALR